MQNSNDDKRFTQFKQRKNIINYYTIQMTTKGNSNKDTKFKMNGVDGNMDKLYNDAFIGLFCLLICRLAGI